MNRKLSAWKALAAIALTFIFSALSARAASPYAGFYSGYAYFSISGTITQPESPVGVAAFSVDENGIITGNITGTVDGSGNITWNANATGFTTGTISGGVLAAITSQNNGGAISTSRIEANNNAGGFGGGGSVGQSLVWRAPTPSGANMLGVTYGGGKFVAVGPGGSVAISGNGTNWISANATTPVQLNAVAYGNGVYVAVGNAQTVISSTDGVNWTARSVSGSPNQNILGVAFGNGVFVAVDIVNEIFTSTDGSSWTTVQGATAGPSWSNIKFLNGIFVAVGSNLYSNSSRIQTSSNGSSWNTEVSAGTGALYDVTYGNGKWLAVGASKVVSFTNADASGATFTSVSGLGDCVGFINGLFISDKCNYSADGITWSRDTYPNIDINDFVTVNNLIVAVGAAISTSTDGKVWTVHTKVLPEPDVNNYSALNNAMTGDYFDEMQYYNYLGSLRYTRVGLNGSIEEKTTLGGTYTNAPSPTTKHLRAAYGFSSSAALIVGDGGTILKYGSSAAVNKFTNAVSGTTANLRSITAATGNIFVVVGDGGTILYTSNGGQSWTGAGSGTSANLNRVAYFGSPFN